MATITVVAPKVVFPGPMAHFEQWTEANSVSVAAGRIAVQNTAGKWAACASDPAIGTVLGRNVVAGSNVTTLNPTTDIFIFTPGVIIEINSNASGTDPVRGLAYSYVVSTNDHQLDQADTSHTDLMMLQLAPQSTSGDTNVAVWAVPVVTSLVYGGRTAS